MRTSRLDFGSCLDPDPAYQWDRDTKCKLFSLMEVCALPSAVRVICLYFVIIKTAAFHLFSGMEGFLTCLNLFTLMS